MSLDFASAFKKPFTDVKKLLIGIALNILPIVSWIATGFILSSAKAETKNDKKLPEWKDWGNLFVKGLLAYVIGFIYSLPVLLVALIALGRNLMALFKEAITGGAGMQALFASMGNMLGVIALVALLGLLVAYIAPSAIMHYVVADNFGAAFNFKGVFKKAFSGNYAAAWIVGGLYGLLLGWILSFIPFVGGAVAGFISGLTMFSLIGEAFKGK